MTTRPPVWAQRLLCALNALCGSHAALARARGRRPRGRPLTSEFTCFNGYTARARAATAERYSSTVLSFWASGPPTGAPSLGRSVPLIPTKAPLSLPTSRPRVGLA